MPKKEPANSKFPQVLEDFYNYKITIQNCSVKTAQEYLVDLRTFFRYVIAARDSLDLAGDQMKSIDISGVDIDFVRSIRTTEIYGFLTYAANVRGNSFSARSRKLSSIKSFFKYYNKKAKLLTHDPSADIDAPKAKKSLPKYLTLEESLKLLETVQNDTENPSRRRDYAVITLFLNCGMRLSELCNINLSDLSPDLKNVRVLGKGSKERIIYLNDACTSALEKYLSERRSIEIKPGHKDALFISRLKTRISPKTVQWLVYKYLELAGLKYRKMSTHKLRHTAATLMYQKGKVDVRILKDILGHEQLNTTQIYTHVSDESIKHAMEQNPLAAVNMKKDGDRD